MSCPQVPVVVVRHFSDRPWIFQEDNAPCHVALRANKWKEENGIRILLWPPQSPYLNIIENVWKVLKIQVHKRLREIKNADDLRRVVLDIWTGYVCTTYEVYMTVYLGGSGVF